MKKTMLALAALATFAGAAQADLTANVSLTTKYKYRGQDQSDATKYVVPAIQGGFDYSLGGFYVGNWNSSVGFGHGTEMDFYGGYKGEAGGIGYDVGLLQYYYPGSGASALNTTEVYGAVSYAFLTAKYSHTVSDDYFGLGDAYQSIVGGSMPKGRGTGYLDLSANYEVVKGITINGHVGYTRLSSDLKDVGFESYMDYKAGATYDFGGGLTLGGHYVGANKKSFYGDVNKGRVIVTLTKTM